jgi:general nucleoside transport system ATP-binding protein
MEPRERMEADVVLRLSGIGKRFGSLVANADIDLELRRGEVVALLGENGAGKTTLMNILFGHYVADSGSIEVFGRPLPPGKPQAAIAAGIGMVHQHFTLAANLTVLENVMLGTEPLWRPWTDRRSGRRKLLALAEKFGLRVDPDALVSSLSVGEKQRVEILKALYRDARLLILDEPTGVLTPQESEALFATLKRLVGQGLSILFISHKLNEVLAVTDRVVVLRAGRKVADFATAQADKATLAERMVGRAVPKIVRETLPAGKAVLELDEVTFVGAHGRALLDRVSLTVRRHEIVGIAGVSGNGQGALAELVAGMAAATSGRLAVVGETVTRARPADMVRRGVGRIPEDRHATGLVPDMTIAENLISERYRQWPFSRFGFLRRAAADRHAREIIAEFDVRCPSPAAVTRLLSGGNMQKLVLARALSQGPHLVLANQPTRGLDIGAVTYIHERLLAARASGAGVLLISEDLDEILAIADRIVVIHRGHLSRSLCRGEASIGDIGLMMAGQEPDNRDHAA